MINFCVLLKANVRGKLTRRLSWFINCSASSQPLENCSNLAASGGFFVFPPKVDFLKAVHCLRASLSCSTLRFNSDNRLSKLLGSPAFSNVFNKLWLSISLCWISLYLSESCLWCDAACTPWSAENVKRLLSFQSVLYTRNLWCRLIEPPHHHRIEV